MHSFPPLKHPVDERHGEFHRERNIGIDIKFLPLWITDLTLELNFLLLDLARDGISDRREIFGDRLQRFN